MTENPQLPDAPATTAAPAEQQPAARRTFRDRLPSGRKAVAAGAVLAGLAVGGAGFGAGYAVADSGTSDTATTQTTGDWGDRQMPDGGPGQMGQMPGGGQMGGMPGGTTQGDGGTTGEQPDFDGDGQPDTDTESGSGTTTDSSTLNS